LAQLEGQEQGTNRSSIVDIALERDSSVDGIHHTDGVELALQVLESGAEEVVGGVDYSVSSAQHIAQST
jgi:hypothetical protein